MNEQQEMLLLDLDSAPNFSFPDARHVQRVDKFIPPWIELPFTQAVLSVSFDIKSSKQIAPDELSPSVSGADFNKD
jgi:hypothetical protein